MKIVCYIHEIFRYLGFIQFLPPFHGGLNKTLMSLDDMVAVDFHRELLKSGITNLQTVC